MGSCPDAIHRLIEHFDRQLDQVRSPDYNEAQLRIDFVNPMFAELGWDMDNRQGYAEQYREVVHEDRIKVAGATKAPDYSFRIGGVRKFFLEAKKPFVNISQAVEPAYQLRRYGWSAKLAVSLLTNFQELGIYDCRQRPTHLAKASEARRDVIQYTDYPTRWDFIAGTFSKRAVLTGEFDRYCATKKGRGTEEFDDAFLAEIEEWRRKLASNLARHNDINEHDLNFATQRIIDRIIFLRICEDRGVEPVGHLQQLLNGDKTYRRLTTLFRDADARYNSGLFHFKPEAGRDEAHDELTLSLQIDDAALKSILKRLYYPESPYEFSVVSADILGSVYERFLGNVIERRREHGIKIVEKPEVRKAGGVYYTPAYIVDYIVKQTVGKLLEGKTPKQGAKLKVLDPACGSGSFLLGAYQHLLDWHLSWYVNDGPEKYSKGKNATLRPADKPSYTAPAQNAGAMPDPIPALGHWARTTQARKQILLDNIHGVDIDYQAVEVTKLSLLLRCLEGETAESLRAFSTLFRERALPDLGHNIQCGNSLIGTDIMTTDAWREMSADERRRINPFDFDYGFPQVFKQGGFDAVIGNPPYIDSEWMSVHWPETREYCVGKYPSASGNWDIFCVFIDRGLSAAMCGGLVSMIVPNKLATANYAAVARRVAAVDNTLRSVRDYSRVPVFPVSVYPIVFVTAREKIHPKYVSLQRIETSREPSIFTEKTVDLPYASFADPVRGWDLSLSVAHRVLANRLLMGCEPLGQFSEVVGAATVAEAYELTSLLQESVRTEDLRVVNSGTIDRYVLLWGTRPMRYLGTRFDRPVVAASNFSKLPVRRLAQAQKPKIIIAGMTLRPEAAIDPDGKVLAGKSTTLVFPYNHIKAILACLNSRVIAFFYEQEFGGNKLAGGYLRIGPPQIKRLPIPTFKAGLSLTRLDKWVDEIQSLHNSAAAAKSPAEKERLKRQIDATDRQIDQLVYQLYGLSDADIQIVESATAGVTAEATEA